MSFGMFDVVLELDQTRFPFGFWYLCLWGVILELSSLGTKYLIEYLETFRMKTGTKNCVCCIWMAMEEPMMLENYSEFGQLVHRPSHTLE